MKTLKTDLPMRVSNLTKWIDGADRGRELAKLEKVFGNEKTALKAV